MLYKGTTFDTKDLDKSKRTAIIKFASYGTLDRDNDMSTKGMFTRSWNNAPQDIRFFLNHEKKQAPGRPEAFSDGRPAFWEDESGAYARVKLGTHTLGEDVLKMMDEGIITNNSFGFDPIQSTQIKDKGKMFKEVKLWEVSVLTHWGAHPDSTVMEVHKNKKGQKDYMGRFEKGDDVMVRPGYEHDPSHAGVEMEIMECFGNYEPYGNSHFYSVELPDGSIHKWYRGDELIPTLNDNDAQEESAEMAAMDVQIQLLEKFCKNTSASDATIIKMQAELEEIKSARQLLNNTAVTRKRNDPAASVNNEFAGALQLLTLKF